MENFRQHGGTDVVGVETQEKRNDFASFHRSSKKLWSAKTIQHHNANFSLTTQNDQHKSIGVTLLLACE